MQARPAFIIIIPVRYASVRFPGKPLAKIAGKAMIQYVYEQACLSNAERVYIATDDKRIAEEVQKFDAPIVMTAERLASGTERVFAAASSLKLPPDSLIVNVQGDEPLLPPENINQTAALLRDDVDMASLSTPIEDYEQLINKDCVKVVMDKQGRALYFSRSIIPYSFCRGSRKEDLSYWQRHLGIYAYRMDFLTKYTAWRESAYERLEKLEQLRALYYGATIQLARAQSVPPLGVDSPADIQMVEALLAKRAKN